MDRQAASQTGILKKDEKVEMHLVLSLDHEHRIQDQTSGDQAGEQSSMVRVFSQRIGAAT